MGNCRFPHYFTSVVAREWFGVRKLINESRMARQGWPFSDPLEGTSISHLTLKLFWAIAERNQDHARRRYLRACTIELGQELDVSAEGTLLPEPHDGQAIPAEAVGTPLSLPSRCSLLFGSQAARITVQVNINSLQASASKRPGEPLDASSKQERRTPKGSE